MTVSQPPVPSPSMEVSTDSIESEKVRRPCRFGQNLPLQAKGIQPEKPFPFHVCTMEADGSGNKRLTEKSVQ